MSGGDDGYFFFCVTATIATINVPKAIIICNTSPTAIISVSPPFTRECEPLPHLPYYVVSFHYITDERPFAPFQMDQFKNLVWFALYILRRIINGKFLRVPEVSI